MSGAPARPSASIILVRDGPAGLETFMVRRHARSAVAPSAYVFPGGTVRDDDLQLGVADDAALAETISARSDTPMPPREAAALYVCAIRELFEEAGVLLVRDGKGELLTVRPEDTTFQERLQTTRLALQAGDLTIGQVLAEAGWQPAFDCLVPFSHWITPEPLAARFDARFFVAELPSGQSALHDTIETSEGVWLAPRQLLDGDYHTVFATAQHLRRLAEFSSVPQLLAFARSKPIRMVRPTLVEASDGVRVLIDPEVADRW
jgi:8-oxo-dGTP pyrophosphatase MutT (NUDIX family)